MTVDTTIAGTMTADTTAKQPCPNHTTHTYAFPELSHLTSTSNQQPYQRVLVFFSKKPGLTDAFFHSHWKSVHADLTMQVPDLGVNLVRYSQFHQEQVHKDALGELMDESNGSMRMVQWDGAAEFWVRELKDFVEFFRSVYREKSLVGCGTRFVDLVQGYHVMAGYENLIYGAGIPGLGTDGIMPWDKRLRFNGEGEAEKKEAAEAKIEGEST